MRKGCKPQSLVAYSYTVKTRLTQSLMQMSILTSNVHHNLVSKSCFGLSVAKREFHRLIVIFAGFQYFSI